LIDDHLRRIQAIKGLVADGTGGSLRKAIEGLNQLHEMIIKDQVTISFDDHCSVDSEFDNDW